MFIKYTSEKYLEGMLERGEVQLSTFWTFQAHEKKEIGDPEEGQAGFVFHNDTEDPWEITPELLDAAAMSVIGHPRFTESKTLQPGHESRIEAAGGFNTFMYSLTEAESPSNSLMKRLEYDKAIEICDLGAFANHTGQALRDFVIKELGFEDKGITRVRTSHKEVDYVSSKRRVVTPSTIDVLQPKDEVSQIELFTKLEEFRYQSEYRIAYYFMNPDTDRAVSLNVQFPNLRPVIVGDAKIPRISKTLRLIEPSEFVK